MPSHRLFLDQVMPPAGERLVIAGEETAHAVRVKRLAPGESVELLDGRGTIAVALVERIIPGRHPELAVEIESVRTVAPVRPAVHVWAATPKGGRVDDLVESLSQVGAASWTPMRTERSIVSPRDTKLDRLRRIAVESAKQCGRAWLLEIAGGERRLEEALRPNPTSGAAPALVIADASGSPYRAMGSSTITLLIGPEGGWSPNELAAARDAGATIARFGPHTMRIETATIAAAAIVLDVERRLDQ